MYMYVELCMCWQQWSIRYASNTSYMFVSFGTNDSVGVVLHDTNGDDGEDEGVLVVQVP